jgi:hypothetical protein
MLLLLLFNLSLSFPSFPPFSGAQHLDLTQLNPSLPPFLSHPYQKFIDYPIIIKKHDDAFFHGGLCWGIYGVVMCDYMPGVQVRVHEYVMVVEIGRIIVDNE